MQHCDWSSDVCSSDLISFNHQKVATHSKSRSTLSVEVSHRQQHRSCHWICFSTRSSPDTTTISDTQPQVYMSYATSYHTVCGFENHHGDLFIASFVGLRSSPRSKSKPSRTTRWTHLASFYRCGYRNTNTYVASLAIFATSTIQVHLKMESI